jgi:hypothetical protein
MNMTFTLISLLCLAGLTALFAIGGALLTYRGFLHRSQGGISQEWPVTSGEILESAVREATTTGPGGVSETNNIPFVRYRYRVGKDEYTGSTISSGLSNTAGGPEQARTIVERYPIGSSVNVFYNPRNPQESILEKRTESAGASIAIGIVLMLISLGMVCLVAGLAIFGYIAILAS